MCTTKRRNDAWKMNFRSVSNHHLLPDLNLPNLRYISLISWIFNPTQDASFIRLFNKDSRAKKVEESKMVTGCPQMPSRWVGFLQGPSTNEYTIYVKARVATAVILGDLGVRKGRHPGTKTGKTCWWVLR